MDPLECIVRNKLRLWDWTGAPKSASLDSSASQQQGTKSRDPLPDYPNLVTPSFVPLPNMMQNSADNPDFTQRLQSPEYQSLMISKLNDLAALQALMQLNQGISQLQRIAPNVLNMSGGIPTNTPGTSSTTTAPTGTTPTQPTTATTTSSTTPNPTNTITPPSAATQEAYSLMIHLLSSMDITDAQPPEERHCSQLEQSANTGFVNREANLQDNMIVESLKKTLKLQDRLLGQIQKNS